MIRYDKIYAQEDCMLFRETETVELKEIVTEEIKREITAFANTKGGEIFVGVRDDGTPVGLDDVDSASLQISSMVRDGIKPDLSMFLRYEIIDIEDKKLLKLTVQEGTDRPYYLTKKGMRVGGVYVRQGFSVAPASDKVIRKMIMETYDNPFDEKRSLEQELTFNDCEKEFSGAGLQFGEKQMRSLKMIGEDGLYTNLAYLVSDQSPFVIDVAVFQGDDMSVFRDRRAYSGALFKVLDDVYSFLDEKNQTLSSFGYRYYRVDIRDYPQTAVRETLVNMIVHRDYSKGANSFIKIFSDRIEFLSVGGLVPGISEDELMIGVSVPRNENLVHLFYRLHIIEAYGTGIGKIFDSYKEYNVKPQITVTENYFRVVLPNVNEAKNEMEKAVREGEKNSALEFHDSGVSHPSSRREEKVIGFIIEHGTITNLECAELLSLSSSTSNRLLRKMTDDGILTEEGKARNTKYCLAPEKKR